MPSLVVGEGVMALGKAIRASLAAGEGRGAGVACDGAARWQTRACQGIRGGER